MEILVKLAKSAKSVYFMEDPLPVQVVVMLECAWSLSI